MAGRRMKLTHNPKARSEQKKNTERLDKFQDGMADLQKTPTKNILGTNAATIYKRIARTLNEQGFTKEIDINLVNLLAMHIDIYFTAYRNIVKNGIQVPIFKTVISPAGEIIEKHQFQGYKKNPAVETLNMATNQIKSISDKLGMSPTSRASMLANIKQDDDNEPSIKDLLYGDHNEKD